MEKSAAYIKHISISVSINDRSAPYRTFFDNWFAHYSKGPFLNKNGTPKWFNNPDPVKENNALKAMHYVSDEARQILMNEKAKIPLVKDHSIPVSILRDYLLKNVITDEAEIFKFLVNNYRIAVITKNDDNALVAAGYRSKMPSLNFDSLYPLGRYEAANIKIFKCADVFDSSD